MNFKRELKTLIIWSLEAGDDRKTIIAALKAAIARLEGMR